MCPSRAMMIIRKSMFEKDSSVKNTERNTPTSTKPAMHADVWSLITWRPAATAGATDF